MAVPVRVFVLDDHELVRRGIAELLANEEDLQIVGEAATAAQALDRIPSSRPDVALLDVRLGEGPGASSGIEVCRDIRSTNPNVACLMLTSFSDDQALFASIMAGAAGYLLKQVHGSDLVGALRRVASGESLLDPAVTARVLDRIRNPPALTDPLDDLTPQERRILALISDGKTNRQISKDMYLAEALSRTTYLGAGQAGDGPTQRTRHLRRPPVRATPKRDLIRWSPRDAASAGASGFRNQADQ